MFTIRIYLVVVLISAAFSCNGNAGGSNSSPTTPTTTAANVPVAGYEIVRVYPHDDRAFTQGLIYDGGFLYESTGQRGQSTLRKVGFETGDVIRRHNLAPELFAEGIALLDGKIYQLTWTSGIGFVYDMNDFKLLREFRYSGEGWGLATDGKVLFHSDGTHVIRVIDPEGYRTIRTLVVNDESGKPLMRINELEWVKGELWANIWQSEKIGKPNHIARIDPDSGKLLGWIDLQGISPEDSARSIENSLNGIAYDEENDRLFVTGKYWKKLFEIKLKETN